ncbi:MAG: hypothetical protein KAJ14_06705, partial [Candidatus Omnitrophica bacterium]|nr:hypothetical protein [Candidatus Omnitrophota bacterium]
MVYTFLIMNSSFGAKFAEEYNLDLPVGINDENLYNFTYTLYVKFWLYKLFPEVDPDEFGFNVFSGYEAQVVKAIEGSMSNLDLNYYLSLLTEEQRVMTGLGNNYDPKEHKFQVDMKNAILEKVNDTEDELARIEKDMDPDEIKEIHELVDKLLEKDNVDDTIDSADINTGIIESQQQIKEVDREIKELFIQLPQASQKEDLLDEFKGLWVKVREARTTGHRLQAADQGIEVLYVRGSDTDGNECSIYIGDIVIVTESITPASDGPHIQKYALVNKIVDGKIYCVSCDDTLEDIGNYDVSDLKKIVVSEEKESNEYRKGEKLLIKGINGKIYMGTIYSVMGQEVRVAVFGDSHPYIDFIVNDKDRIHGRNWQEFDELLLEEKPVSLDGMKVEINKMLKDSELLFGKSKSEIPGDIENKGFIEFDNNIKVELRYSEESDTAVLNFKNNDEVIGINSHLYPKISHYNSIKPSDYERKGLRYISNDDGTGALWIVFEDEPQKGFKYKVGNLTIDWCTPKQYVEMMKKRRESKVQGLRLKDKGEKDDSEELTKELLKECGLEEENWDSGILNEVVKIDNEKQIRLQHQVNGNENSWHVIMEGISGDCIDTIALEDILDDIFKIKEFNQGGIIRIDKGFVYIRIGEKFLKVKISGNKIAETNITDKRKAYGENFYVRKEIVQLGVEYKIKSIVDSQGIIDEIQEMEEILEEIKGYLEYGDIEEIRKQQAIANRIAMASSHYSEPEMSEKEMWDVRALALRVYQLIGEKMDIDYFVENDIFRMYSRFLNTGRDFMFADNLGDSNVNRDDLDRELIIDVTRQNLEGNKDNLFIAKQLVQSFEQMFKVWEDKEIRKRIVVLLVTAIKPENNDEINMEILKVLDEICPEIEEKDTVSNVLKKIITTEEYSLQVRSKVRSMYGETYFDLENVLFHLLNDLNISLKVRLEASEELVRIAEQKGLEEEVNKKKEEFRKKIWEMWNKKKKDNQLAEFGPVYTWVLYGLGENIEVIRQKIKKNKTLQE